MLGWPYPAVAFCGCRLACGEPGCESDADVDAASALNGAADGYADAGATTRTRGRVCLAQRCAKCAARGNATRHESTDGVQECGAGVCSDAGNYLVE